MKITIVGAGHVGLVTGVGLASKGHDVICVDICRETVRLLNCGEAPFHEPGLHELIQAGLQSGRFRVTSDLNDATAESQMTFIAVNTPFKKGSIDLNHVRKAANQIGRSLRRLKPYHVVVVKSTVVPGSTGTIIRRELERASGLEVGNFGLCMNPEFLREGSAVEDFLKPDRIVIGEWDGRSGQILDELYQDFDCLRLHTSLENAELIKYTSNALLASLISFSNEIASLCEKVPGSDVETVMKGLHLDHRLSPRVNGQRVSPGILNYLRAGSGFGGSCLPKDVNALRSFAQKLKLKTFLLDAVMQVNQRRTRQVIRLLEKKIGKLQGRTIVVLGLAFKPGTDDLRESPALRIIQELLKKGAKVRAYDPIAISSAKAILDSKVALYDKIETALSGSDAAVIATGWPEFAQWDWGFLGSQMHQPIILDGRNTLAQVSLPENLIYQPVGINPRP